MIKHRLMHLCVFCFIGVSQCEVIPDDKGILCCDLIKTLRKATRLYKEEKLYGELL